MRNFNFKKYTTTLSLIVVTYVLLTAFYVHNEKSTFLFKIERSVDKNEVIYEVNFDSNGKLNQENPIKVYWLKYTENSKKEPLSWIQNSYSYGLKFLKRDNSKEEYTFQFVSYDKRTFTLKKTKIGTYEVFTTSKNSLIKVEEIYINIQGGTFWFPTIDRVELLGREPKTNTKIKEIIHP